MKVPCLRCGDFLPANPVPLCERCLEAAPPPQQKPVVVTPPPELFWRQLAVPIAFALAGVALSAWWLGLGYFYPRFITTTAPAGPLAASLVVGGLVGFLVAGVASYLLLVPPFANVGFARYRELFLSRLGFDPERGAGLALVFLVDRAGMKFEVHEPGELALLHVSDEGLAFLAARGTVFVARRGELESVGLRRLWCTWPTRTAVALELADGTRRYFAYLDGESYRANRERADAAVERLRRLVTSP